jgi:hypothetical protein
VLEVTVQQFDGALEPWPALYIAPWARLLPLSAGLRGRLIARRACDASPEGDNRGRWPRDGFAETVAEAWERCCEGVEINEDLPDHDGIASG